MTAGRQLAVVEDAGGQVPAPAPRQSAGGLLRPIAAPADVLASQNEARGLIQGALQGGRDYGVVPGTDKPTLFKPGAERILAAFGCYGDPEIIEREVDHDREVRWQKRKKKWRNKHKGDRAFTWETEEGTSLGLYRYLVRIRVIQRETGAVIGSGVGSCSSLESKYIDRPRDTENTVLKMAKKRAEVDAVLSTFGLSDQFAAAADPDAAATELQEPGAPTPAATDEPVATDEQLQLVEQLARSHVWTVREVRGFERRLGDGLSKVRAAELITWMLQEQKARKLAEAAGGNVPPREPGEDDDEDEGA